MLDNKKTYQLKIDNPNHLYNITILDEEINIDIINAKMEIRPEIFNSIKLTKINPVDIKQGNEYQIISNNSTIFHKTTITSIPIIDTEKKCISFQGRILGEPRLASKGIVQFYIPLDRNDMLIYNLETLGRYTNG